MSRCPTLAEVQRAMQDFLLHGDRAIEAYVAEQGPVPLATRLGIYAGAYRSRLVEALESNYPVLAKRLGASGFAALGRAYVETHPSRFRSIRWYGDRLADFLAMDGAYAGAPVLAELARWEWALTEVFDAADAAAIDAGALAHVPPERWSDLRFDWHPSVRRLTLRWNVPQIWKALASGGEPPPDAQLDGPQEWLLWRSDLRSLFRSLEASEAELVDRSRAGETFGELCERLCAYVGPEAAPAQAAGYLRGWIASGLLTGVRGVS